MNAPHPADQHPVSAPQPDDSAPPEPTAGEAEPPPPPPDLPVEHAVAFGVEGYDPDDPWNAALYVEADNVLTVLPLTPKTLEGLLGSLSEVDQAQRSALGATNERTTDVDDEEADRPKAMQRVAHAARVMTGNQPVYRLWNTSTRGRVIIIGAAVLFVLIGVILSVL